MKYQLLPQLFTDDMEPGMSWTTYDEQTNRLGQITKACPTETEGGHWWVAICDFPTGMIEYLPRPFLRSEDVSIFFDMHRFAASKEWTPRTSPIVIPWAKEDTPLPSQVGSIYFIAADNGLVKIGFSRDVQQRMESLQTMSPAPIQLMGTMPGTVTDERRIHARFAHLRSHGEWFWSNGELLTFIENEVTTCHN